ncbi:hypothetical protein Bca101_081390 [Brassica carinata]
MVPYDRLDERDSNASSPKARSRDNLIPQLFDLGEQGQLTRGDGHTELVKLEKEKARSEILDEIRIQREETDKWWERPPNELDLSQNTCLINALEKLRMDLGSQRSQQAMVPQNYYDGSNNNIVGGVKTELFDQKSMFDENAFNYNPNMMIPNQGPTLGNSNMKPEVFDPIYNMNWPEYRHGPYWDQGRKDEGRGKKKPHDINQHNPNHGERDHRTED